MIEDDPLEAHIDHDIQSRTSVIQNSAIIEYFPEVMIKNPMLLIFSNITMKKNDKMIVI
jgi:hypothetical protein